MESNAGASGRSYRDLLVWQKAMDLVDRVYDLADVLPVEERYGLTSQLKRAVASDPVNIAEGQGRATSRDFANFLTIARGSLFETETLLLIAQRRQYLDVESVGEAFEMAAEVGRMLSGLRSKIRLPREIK